MVGHLAGADSFLFERQYFVDEIFGLFGYVAPVIVNHGDGTCFGGFFDFFDELWVEGEVTW
jgi:hypothetical protein